MKYGRNLIPSRSTKILILFVLIVGCSTAFKKAEVKNLAKLEKDCYELEKHFSLEMQKLWKGDKNNALINRRKFYNKFHHLLKDTLFLGYRVDCIKKILGSPDIEFDPKVATKKETKEGEFLSDKDYPFISNKELKIAYILYMPNKTEGQRDSSIVFNIFYRRKNKKIIRTRLDVGEDIHFKPFVNESLGKECLDYISKLYNESNWKKETLLDTSIIGYRKNFPFRSVGNDFNKITLPCFEKKFGKADQYLYEYGSNQRLIYATYVLQRGNYIINQDICFNMDDLKCVSKITIPIN
ncbi:MAG: hypothetical protein AAFY45_35130 [Bacteroidota bacterium]